MVGERGHVASTLGAKRGGDQPHRSSLLKGSDHIRTLSGRRDRDGDIAGLSQCLDLARECAFEAEIVARGRERRAIGGQRNGSDRGTIALVTDRQFGREMLGVGRAPSVSEEHQLAAAAD
jgi:hypothetical protein